MKTAQTNPTKTQLLAWANASQPSSLPKITDLSQLGNGVVYLHILLKLHPGTFRPEKICRTASTVYDIRSNLTLLLATFQKLGLSYKFQVDKIAQMKYQDNFHLASFLFKLQQQQKQKQGGDNSKKTQRSSRVKVVPPANLKSVPMKKNPLPPVTPQTLAELNREIKPKEQVQPKKDEKTQEKLQKIASFLNVNPKSSKKVQIPAENYNKSCMVEQSYRRILRKTVCDQSKYLNSFPILNSFKDYQEWNTSRGSSGHTPQNIRHHSKHEESMLLSSNKNQMLLSSQKKTEKQEETEGENKDEERCGEGKELEEKGELETKEEGGEGEKVEWEGGVV